MHSDFINRCFELALKGKGAVEPNPLVGSVIVKDGKIIAEGFHSEYGAAHAEPEALKNADKNSKNATLYCNLEPCCHYKKQTPPCVPQIIEAGISKVVISNLDPNPQVAGNGIKQLEDAGIEVITGIEEEKGAELNRVFFKYITQNLPFVTMKIAQTLDGKITSNKGIQSWITGKESVKYVHKLRAENQAVLVGAGTVQVDNPQLTVREVEGRNPIKVIVDAKLGSPANSNVFRNDPENTILFTSIATCGTKLSKLKEKGVKIFQFEVDDDGLIDLVDIFRTLANEKISSLLIEGGAQIFSQVADNKLFDELVILQGTKIFGGGLDAFETDEKMNLIFKEVTRLGEDIKIISRLKK